MLIANSGGLLHFDANPGDYVKTWDVVVRVMDPYGNVVDGLKSPKNEYICAFPFMQSHAIATGDHVAPNKRRNLDYPIFRRIKGVVRPTDKFIRLLNYVIYINSEISWAKKQEKKRKEEEEQ